jgi:RNA polymerase sigma-70 factor (ECF subfamily)
MAKVIHGAPSLHSPQQGAHDFQAIYREHYPAIWRFLLHLGVRHSDVADVTHNVFMIAYKKLPSFEQRSSMRTWLCGIAFRVGRRFQRSAAVRLEVSADDPTLVEALGSTSAADGSGHDGELALAQRLLNALPPEQREVFVLHELEQMTGSEIAELMGTSIGTVRSRLRRARDSFQKQIAVLKRGGVRHV